MNSPYRKLSKGEKWSLFILSAATLSIVILSAWQMKSTIFSPFERNPSGELREQLDPTKNIDDLRSQDTDQDGLSDFDELYVHATSPYLPDSDSDGITDSAEIKAGKDPNCPEGQDCYVSQGDSSDEGSLEDIDLTEEEKAQLIMQLPTEQLRELLINAGVPAETMDQLTDDQLKEMVNNILSGQTGGSASATSTQE